jgi:hypothetical protein
MAKPDVTHGIGELHGQRLFGRLGLEFVGGLLTLRIIGSVLIGRFGNHEGVAAGVDDGCFVTCSNARGIRLRFFLPHAWHPRNCQDDGAKNQFAALPTARIPCMLFILHNPPFLEFV